MGGGGILGGQFGGGGAPGGAFGGGLGGVPGAMGGAAQPAEGGGEGLEDMPCSTGAHAAAWASVKQRFRAVTSAPLGMAPREVLMGALEEAMQDLKAAQALAPESASECGLGKLCLQLLSIVTIDDPAALTQLFSSIEQIASPVLTLLLDVPWAAVAQAGWPFFGLLAQLNLRKGHTPGALNTEAIDGLDDPTTRAFHGELTAALGKDGAALEAAAQAFLQKELQAGSAMGPLTAMAAQAAGTPQTPVRQQMLTGMQAGMKQVIGSAAELDIALSTQWPVWGLLHVGVDSLASA